MQNDLKEILESSRNSFASPHPVSQGLDNVRNPVLEHMVRPNAYHIRGRAYSGRALQSSPQSGFERFEGSVSRGSEYQQAVNPLFDNYYQKKREWRDIKNSKKMSFSLIFELIFNQMALNFTRFNWFYSYYSFKCF